MFIYPNPIQTNAIFTYSVEKDGPVSISLYDFSGRLVQNILQNETQHAGKHEQSIYFNHMTEPGNYMLVIQTDFKKAGLRVTKE